MNKLIASCITCFILLTGCNQRNQTAPTTENLMPGAINDQSTAKSISQTEKGQSTHDMVYFKSGKIDIGSAEGSSRNSPVFATDVAPFYLDKYPVTVAQFASFVEASGYKTEAEKFGDSGVFDFNSGIWQLVKGAWWKYPLGPDKPEADPSHPVTQVSWNDAVAFANWNGKRLPTEVEWEYAARNGENTYQKFPWGNEETMNGKYLANTWQGNSPTDLKVLDGYLYTSPVGVFGEYSSGLSDLAGNVWEWCSNTFEPYEGSSFYFQVNQQVKAIRGGSFMFDELGSESYTVYGRSFNSAETSLFNMGFRCAKD